MDEFPSTISPSLKNNFEALLFTENLRTLRQELYLHVIRGNESEFYDIDAFNRKYVKNMTKTRKMIDIVITELTSLGWKTFLGFGETGLYIFSDEKPANAY
jgi:hypothetical protein